MNAMVVRLLLCVLVITASLMAGSAFAESPNLGPVTMEQSTSIAKAFVGGDRAEELSYTALATRRMFAPFVACHRFELPLHLNDEEGKPLTAGVLVEENTGRVVQYFCGFGYQKAKARGKEKPKDGDLISEAKAKEIAQGVLAKARISMEGMRLRNFQLVRYTLQDNYCAYTAVYAKYAQLPNIGEVELPVTAQILMDAATGEVYTYIFKERPLLIALAPPQISDGQAIELVKAKKYLKQVSEVVGAHLKVAFDLQDISKAEAELEYDNPSRFYDEVESKRQVLAWEVKLKGVHPFLGETVDLTALVDANTGKVFDYNMPM